MAWTPPSCNDPLVSGQLVKWASIGKFLVRILKEILLLSGTKQFAICRRRRLCSSSWPHFETIVLLCGSIAQNVKDNEDMLSLKNILGILDMTGYDWRPQKSILKEKKIGWILDVTRRIWESQNSLHNCCWAPEGSFPNGKKDAASCFFLF